MRTINYFAVLMLAIAPLAANAADGTITFIGQVTDKTCTIATTGGADMAVPLPTVSTSSLATAGAVAGRTPFTISLTGCSAGDVGTYFEQGNTVDVGSGRLNNQVATPTGAGNVQIQLLGDNSLPLLVRASPQPNSQSVTVAADGSATLNYFAEYYATAAATAGDVSTSVKYTLIYN